jgi:2-oxoglutarate/2-oxoacid ferredoxin oxidoreductase subunit alpha
MEEYKLMLGNEALAEAAIRAGADSYFGYPITPQSEVMEYLTAQKTEERTGMIVLQAESEIGAINMVYGAAGCGKKVIISSSSPGISLMQEGISYLAGAELPCVIVNIMRGGPGLGTIQPSQSDYFQSTRGGGHGDYRTLVLAPSSVQEMADFVSLAFDLAFKYRNPILILADGMIGKLMEKVKLPDQQKRLTDEEIKQLYPWATLGKPKNRKQNIIKSVELNSELQEQNNLIMLDKYKRMAEEDVVFEEYQTEDAEYLLAAFGSTYRICKKTLELARAEGIKLGLFRPVTLYPFPSKRLAEVAKGKKGILTVEMNAGQMIEDVKLAVNGAVPVEFYGRLGGIFPPPNEVLENFKKIFKL